MKFYETALNRRTTMEQNKSAPIALSSLKPSGASAIAAVKPAAPSVISVTPKAAETKPMFGRADFTKKAEAKKTEAKKPARKKTAAKKKSAASSTATKEAAAKRIAARKQRIAAQSTKKAARKKAPSAQKSTARSAAWGREKLTKSPFAAASASTRGVKTAASESPSKFFSLGADALKGMFGSSSAEAQKISEKAFGFGREGAEHITRSADAATRSINEIVAIGQDNLEACVECGNIATEVSRSVGEELYKFSNNLFSKNVELSRSLFACRTINDLFDLQSKAFKLNIDQTFSETAKLSEMAFKMANRVSDPINGRVAENSKRLSKAFAS
jgi:hypothetical protein